MPPSHCVMLFTLTTALAGVAQAQAPSMVAPRCLVDSRTVGPNPAPDAPPFLKQVVIPANAGGCLEDHSYYWCRIQAGRQKRSGRLETHFAFVTDPREGAYQTSRRQVWQVHLAGMMPLKTRGFLLIREATNDVAL
jgi:hypothetical protein